MYRDDFSEIQRNAYWSLPRAALMVLFASAMLYGIGFMLTGGDLFIYRFWAPKMENAKRQVFENTQSYVQGKISYLSTLRMEYEHAAHSCRNMPSGAAPRIVRDSRAHASVR